MRLHDLAHGFRAEGCVVPRSFSLAALTKEARFSTMCGSVRQIGAPSKTFQI